MLAAIRVIRELTRRFDHYVETGDDSKIPADLQMAIFSTVCSSVCWFNLFHLQAVLYGGRREYDAVMAIQENPKTPTSSRAAMCVWVKM
jgi:aminopeptidase 2